MSTVEWTDAEREALTEHELTYDPQEDTYGREIERVGCLCGAWAWDANDEDCVARWWDHVLDAALAPFVAARVERAVQDYAEREKPVLRIESAGQAKNLIEVAWHDIDKRVRQAKADALWEAADSWQTGGWADDLPPAGASRVQLILGMSQRACEWLRERAARIERGES